MNEPNGLSVSTPLGLIYGFLQTRQQRGFDRTSFTSRARESTETEKLFHERGERGQKAIKAIKERVGATKLGDPRPDERG
jgi:hypothetical protein